MTRLAALALTFIASLGLALAPAATASADAPSDAFTATSYASDYLVGQTTEVWLENIPPDIVSYAWEWRSTPESPWSTLPWTMDWFILSIASGSGGEYRGVATDSGGIVHYSEPYVLTVSRLSWSPTPMYLPEGVMLEQSAEFIGGDDALIRWQTATSPFGTWTDLPGADGPELSIPATSSLGGLLLRPAATVSGTELVGDPARIAVLPAEPALPVQADAEAVEANGSLTLIQGAHLDGGTLVVEVPGGDPFAPSTWFHGTAYSAPTSLGWARVSAGELRFDVSGLPAGEHLLLLRLPQLSGIGLAMSDAVRFTIPAATQPAADDGPQLAATGAPTDGMLGALGVLALAFGALLLSRGRRRAPQR